MYVSCITEQAGNVLGMNEFLLCIYWRWQGHKFIIMRPPSHFSLSSITTVLINNYSPKWRWIAPVSRRSRVRIPLKPWFFQACSFQLLKLEINFDDHSSLSSITAVLIWVISYIFHIIKCFPSTLCGPEIFEYVTTTGHFWTWGKRGLGNHMTIVTSSFLKRSVFKELFIYT